MIFLDVSRPDPPLRALRAFEATARLGTMAAASEELGISPSAVSHQLNRLENFLGLPLLKRFGRGVQLTDAGRKYYRSVRSAFALLRDATGQVRDHTTPLEAKMSAIPLFAMAWLIPKLPEFMHAHPDISVEIVYANHANYSSDAADLSVRFGSGAWAGFKSTKILPGATVPVCSKAYLARHGPFLNPADLQEQSLIHDQDRSGWSLWFESCNLAVPAHRSGSATVEDGLLARSATLAGLGAALLRPALIESELKSGRLIQIFDRAFDDGRDYYLCERIDRSLLEPEIVLRDWIIDKSNFQ